MTLTDRFSAFKSWARTLKRSMRIWATPSYGQYGEDALVFSALKPGKKGFYVDVGAYDPFEGSNTIKLHKKGWRGLTIEPNPRAAWKFKLWRWRDKHLEVGVSVKPDVLRYYEFEIPMLNTMDGERARTLEADGHKIIRTREIRCDRLDTLLDEFAPDQHIDLLSVDCEGDDLGVIGTIDFERRRPTVVLMEDLEGYFGMSTAAGSSPVMQFMKARGYVPIAQLVYTTVFVARDWRELNKRSGAYREEAIHPDLLPEGAAP